MSNNPPSTPPADPSVSAPAEVLERLVQSCRAEHDPAALGRLLEQTDVPRADGAPRSAVERLEWLARVAHDLGLRTSLSRATAAQAVAVSRGGGLPLVTVSADGASWFYLQASAGRRVHLVVHDARHPEGREERVSAAALDERLGGPTGDERVWLVADPSTPQQAAVSAHGTGQHLPPLQRLVRLLRPEWGDVLAVVAFAVAIGVLMLATPVAVQALVNSVALGGLLQPLVVVALLLLLALTFAAVLTGVQTWVVELIQRRLFVRAVADLAARLPRVQHETYDRIDGPELVNRFLDVITIQKSTAKLLLDALGVVLAVLVGLTVLAFYHPLLLAFDILLLLVIAMVVLGPLKRGERSAIAESTAKYEVLAWLEEITRNPHAFRTGGSQQWILERADSLTRGWVERRASHFRLVFGQILGALGLQVVASTVLLGIGGWLVIQGSLTLGQLVAAELIVTAVVASFAKMGKYLEEWYDLMAAVNKVGYLLDLPVESVEGEQPATGAAAPESRPAGAELEVRGVAWADARQRTLFADVDLHARPGQRIGITGPAGSGKTVFAELLWRLREPAEGAILLDGRDLRDLSTEFLRREVGLASPLEVIHGSVRANVRLQRPFVSDDDVRAALRRVGLLEVVAGLPDGVDTRLHPSGHPLSDGQVRRLMLARAIAGRPRLLVVDDLLDALAESEREELFDMLCAPDAGWTLVLVSDRPEIQRRCDSIVQLGSPADALAYSPV